MAKTLFLAAKKGCPAEFDEIEDAHILEVLTKAYKRHGYTVITALEGGEDKCATSRIEAEQEKGRQNTGKTTYPAGMRINSRG